LVAGAGEIEMADELVAEVLFSGEDGIVANGKIFCFWEDGGSGSFDGGRGAAVNCGWDVARDGFACIGDWSGLSRRVRRLELICRCVWRRGGAGCAWRRDRGGGRGLWNVWRGGGQEGSLRVGRFVGDGAARLHAHGAFAFG
jgi:hypothetical protein